MEAFIHRLWPLVVASLLTILSGVIGEPGLTSSDVALNYTTETHASYSSRSSLSPGTPANIDGMNLDDPYLSRQWGPRDIGVSGLWQFTTGDDNVVVAILDTGIDAHHEELANKVVAAVNFTDSPTAEDFYGHGTHVAGIIAASAGNGIGITGLAPGSSIMNVKVADDTGRCLASAIARGITWAVDNGARVINISLELTEPSPMLEEAVDHAWEKGALVIAAAGNEGSEAPIYPAYYDNVISVAALETNGELAPLSNHGDWVDVAAPGYKIYGTLPNNTYGYKSGTSFAAAHVSGLAALLFSLARDSNGNNRINDEVRDAIEVGYRKSEPTGWRMISAASSLDYINRLCPTEP